MVLASFRLSTSFACDKISLPNVAEFARNNVNFGIIGEWILTNIKRLDFFCILAPENRRARSAILFVLDYLLELSARIVFQA
jgi:hypothetical protein